MFLRTLKRDKREKEKIIFSYFCLSSSYTCPVQLFFSFYMETVDRLTPLVVVAALRNQLPSPLERGSVATLPEENTNVRIFIFIHFFLIFIHKRKRKEKMRREKNPGRENLAGRFFYSKRSFILIRIFLLTDKHKTIFWSHILYSGFAVGYFLRARRSVFRAG